MHSTVGQNRPQVSKIIKDACLRTSECFASFVFDSMPIFSCPGDDEEIQTSGKKIRNNSLGRKDLFSTGAPVKCTECDDMFSDSQQMFWHRKTQHSEDENICEFCLQKFETEPLLNKHVAQSHKEELLAEEKMMQTLHCVKCSRNFKTKLEFLHHVSSLHKGYKYQKNKLQFVKEKDSIGHKKANERRNRKRTLKHQCDECGEVFNSQSTLTRHRTATSHVATRRHGELNLKYTILVRVDS